MDIILFERQVDIMKILWQRGSATAAEVLEELQGMGEGMAYTTVLTILRRLEDKGYLGHTTEGRAHRYHPLIEPDEARESALRRLTRGLFEDSPDLLLTHLVSREKLSQEQLRRLRRLVNDELKGVDE